MAKVLTKHRSKYCEEIYYCDECLYESCPIKGYIRQFIGNALNIQKVKKNIGGK